MLIRWIERVEGVDLGKVRREMESVGKEDFSDPAVITYLEQWHKMDMEAIRNKILSKEVRAGLALGAKKIRFGGVTIVLKRNFWGESILATII